MYRGQNILKDISVFLNINYIKICPGTDDDNDDVCPRTR